MFSNLTVKKSEENQRNCSGVFIVNFEDVYRKVFKRRIPDTTSFVKGT